MIQTFTFKIGGPAGFGIVTTGLMFSKVATRSGFHIFDYIEYPSLIRGGHNVMEVHFGSEEIYSQERGIDLLVALNRQTVDLHKANMKQGGAIVYDPVVCKIEENEFESSKTSLFPIPLTEIIKETGIEKVMENNVTMGVATTLFGFDKETLFSIIEDIFRRKGEDVVSENKKAAQAGIDYVQRKGYKLERLKSIGLTNSLSTKKEYAVITGNEAIGMGSLVSGLQFYVAYPMTPSSSILHYIASHAEKAGIVVRHAEDEIGVINEAMGASFAGARSMVGTSGGGFALMNETLSLAGITETPITIIIAQRSGPATGMPTWTEQGELLYAIYAGHGEFPKIVLAPGDPLEAYELTAKALNMADIYQTPVIVLSDKFLSESHKSIELGKLKETQVTIDRGKFELHADKEGDIKSFGRYADSVDGISKRIAPGSKGQYFQANSYEHIPDGHTSEDIKNRIQQVEKRARKTATYLKTHFLEPKQYGPEKASVTLVGWGGVKGPVLEALKHLDHRANFVHFTHMWPMDEQKVAKVLRAHDNLVLIENNSTAQLAKLLRQVTGISLNHKMLKYDGRPFYPEEIVDYVKRNS